MEQVVQRIAFIGGGQMGSAMMHAILRAELVRPAQIAVSDPHREQRAKLADELGVQAYESNIRAVADADLVILAVKPQVVGDVMDELRGKIGRDCTVLSIVAGLSTEGIAASLGGTVRIVRAMPNTPCMVQAGAIAFCLGRRATLRDEKRVRSVLAHLGEVISVPEDLMDAVTGVSGSGPAFIYLIIEALADAGVRAGLPREAAKLLSAQTVYGAAKMVLQTGTHPAELRDMVTSPGGTTISGLHVLEQRGLRGTLMDAVMAAAERSGELGRTTHTRPQSTQLAQDATD